MVGKIEIAIQRSQLAYDLYKKDKLYYQALRIFKANEELYNLLNAFLYQCKKEVREDVIYYLFHLEDWFEQFYNMEANNPSLEDPFIFHRVKDSPSFPKDFIRLISK